MQARSIAVAIAALILCRPVFGQTLYRYVDSSGIVHYSDKPLTESAGRALERMSRSGTHLSDQPAAPKGGNRAAAGDKPRQKDDDLAKFEARRNFALLATYNSLKEIDEAQAFALREPRRELRDAQSRMVGTGRRWEQLQAEADSYGPRKVPSDLRKRLSDAEFDFKNLAMLVEAKRRDVQSLNERYEEDRRRYTQLLGNRPPGKGVQAEAAASPAR